VVSESFSFPFESAGAMLDGHVSTMQVLPKTESVATLRTVLADTLDVSTNILDGDRLEKFRYLKGAKRIERQAANGHRYVFSEGAIPFPDSLDVPSRTMLTSEGTVNRSTHVVADPATGKLRLLLPVEAERLQGFDDGWTEGMPERMRFFCMGNALVVTMVTRMAKTLSSIIAKEP
jgi:DNA (cytosine-5)-methyltransferase 1